MMPTRHRADLTRLALLTVLFVGAACEPAALPSQDMRPACGLDPNEIGRFVEIPSGSFVKGRDFLYPEEGPSIRLQVSGFAIQAHEVTNSQFAAFVEATGYVTDAERSQLEEHAGAGSAVFQYAAEGQNAVSSWTLVRDAQWRKPLGGESSILGLGTHPVVHVSKRDAEAYAEWAGGRLPSEVEWEYAASLGLIEPTDQTSGAYGAEGSRANTWQGVFPIADLGTDGFVGAAPVGCFKADRAGLYDMIGNVWEWTDTPFGVGTHTLKGGSYLCAENFCRRYRPAARQPQEIDFSSNHIGFRIVKVDMIEDEPSDG